MRRVQRVAAQLHLVGRRRRAEAVQACRVRRVRIRLQRGNRREQQGQDNRLSRGVGGRGHHHHVATLGALRAAYRKAGHPGRTPRDCERGTTGSASTSGMMVQTNARSPWSSRRAASQSPSSRGQPFGPCTTAHRYESSRRTWTRLTSSTVHARLVARARLCAYYLTSSLPHQLTGLRCPACSRTAGKHCCRSQRRGSRFLRWRW